MLLFTSFDIKTTVQIKKLEKLLHNYEKVHYFILTLHYVYDSLKVVIMRLQVFQILRYITFKNFLVM